MRSERFKIEKEEKERERERERERRDDVVSSSFFHESVVCM